MRIPQAGPAGLATEVVATILDTNKRLRDIDTDQLGSSSSAPLPKRPREDRDYDIEVEDDSLRRNQQTKRKRIQDQQKLRQRMRTTTGQRRRGAKRKRSSTKASSSSSRRQSCPPSSAASRTATNAGARRAANGIAAFVRPEHNAPMMLPSSSSTPCMAVTSQTVGKFSPAPNNPLPTVIFSPGSIRSPVYESPVKVQEGETTDHEQIDEWGNGTNSQIWTSIQSIGAKYRVIAAHLEVHYIGNDDQNGGEFVINKFKPTPYDDGENHTFKSDDKFPNKINDVAPATAYLPAKKGCEITFFRNDRQVFNAFNHINSQQAETSMEACVFWLDGAATADATKQTWRWTLTQTIELVFEPDSFWSKFHAHPPCGRDEWDALYDRTMAIAENKGADITSYGQQARQMYSAARDAIYQVQSDFPVAAQILGALTYRGAANYLGFNDVPMQGAGQQIEDGVRRRL